MKTKYTHIRILFICLCFLLSIQAAAQGRVVINEYMPWTLNGCGATAEFVELMNFGPGPMNIGCYILTDGDYSVTIPPNTVLQPGEFYVIAGQDLIASPCANIDSTIHADLNWNTCGCTSASIPTTGDGFFTDGGNSNEQVVLLDPNLNVVDAVVRALPAEPSSLITTVATGSCASKSFDLDLMSFTYETLGMSTGRGNSFARKLDGDCGWVKDPQQSANATNNRAGDVSDVNYSLSIVRSMDCDSNHGSIDIFVNVGDYTGPLFPMNYTIALDANNDGLFDFSDTYTYGVDSTPPSIAITGLPLGRYRVTVASVNGCFLRTFNVDILDCISPLAVQLASFKLLDRQQNQRTFEWLMNQTEDVSSVQLQASTDGYHFINISSLDRLEFRGSKIFTQVVTVDQNFLCYRLHWTNKTGRSFDSWVVADASLTASLVWPNPAKDEVNFRFTSPVASKGRYELYAMAGGLLLKGNLPIQSGNNSLKLPADRLAAGVYRLLIFGGQDNRLFSFRFVKH